MPIVRRPEALRGLTAFSSATSTPARNRSVRPPAAVAHSTETRYGYNGWPPRCSSSETSGRWARSHSVTRRVSAVVAPAPSISVTISWWSSSSFASRSHVAADSDEPTDSMPPRDSPIQSPASIAAGGGVGRPHGLGHLARDDARRRRAHRRRVLLAGGLRVVVEQGGEALLDAGGVDDVRRLRRELGDLLGHGVDVLVVREDHDLVARHRVHDLEDLRRRGVHRLPAGDDVVDAERVEDPADAVAGRHRHDRGERRRALASRERRRALLLGPASPTTPPRPGRAGPSRGCPAAGRRRARPRWRRRCRRCGCGSSKGPRRRRRRSSRRSRPRRPGRPGWPRLAPRGST